MLFPSAGASFLENRCFIYRLDSRFAITTEREPIKLFISPTAVP